MLTWQFFVHFKGVHIPRSPFHIISKLKSVIVYYYMSIHGKNWNRKITARLISKNKVRVVLTCCRVHHVHVWWMISGIYYHVLSYITIMGCEHWANCNSPPPLGRFLSCISGCCILSCIMDYYVLLLWGVGPTLWALSKLQQSPSSGSLLPSLVTINEDGRQLSAYFRRIHLDSIR